MANKILYNKNLVFVTTLFYKYDLTKDKKNKIIKDFDAVTSLKESKKLYQTINTSLQWEEKKI